MPNPYSAIGQTQDAQVQYGYDNHPLKPGEVDQSNPYTANYRRKAEGSYAEGIYGRDPFDVLFGTGFKAPNFSYEKQRKYVFRDAQRS